MIQRPGTWGEVEAGVTLLSPTEAPLAILKTAPGKNGALWYLAVDHNGREFKIAPKPSEEPVTILECTPEEAELYARLELKASHVLDIEQQRRMPERAKRWIVPPFPSRGRGALDHARTHIEWYHGAYGGSADYAGGFKTLKEIRAAHAQMHEENFMDMPHTHEDGGN